MRQRRPPGPTSREDVIAKLAGTFQGTSGGGGS